MVVFKSSILKARIGRSFAAHGVVLIVLLLSWCAYGAEEPLRVMERDTFEDLKRRVGGATFSSSLFRERATGTLWIESHLTKKATLYKMYERKVQLTRNPNLDLPLSSSFSPSVSLCPRDGP